MSKGTLKGVFVLAGGILGGWFFIRYALPVLFPFLLGAGLALTAEPMVILLHGRLKMKRWLASGIGVSGVFLLLIALLLLLGALLCRQAGKVTALVPELAESVQSGMGSLEDWLLRSASAAPENVRNVINRTVTGFFSDGSTLINQVAGTLPGILTKIFSHVTNWIFSLATAVLAAFMISGRLPFLRTWASRKLPNSWKSRYLPALRGLRRVVTGWLMAQLKLTLVVMGLLMVSFWLLKVPHTLFWAFVIALVDALPILGCGVILVPWSLICFLQGLQLQSIGLLGTFALTWLARNILEPKLLGKELGLDPLVTLLAIYAGLRLLGLVGMILAPLIALIVTKFTSEFSKDDNFSGNNP